MLLRTFDFERKKRFTNFLLGHWSTKKKIQIFKNIEKTPCRRVGQKNYNFAPGGAANHTFFYSPCIYIYVAYSRSNGWTEWADIFGCLRLKIFEFFFHGQRRALQLVFIYFACLFVRLNSINVKMDEPIRPKFCVVPRMYTGKVFGRSKLQKSVSKNFLFL